MSNAMLQAFPASLRAELSEVQDQLLHVSADLKPPLNELVTNQVHLSQPLIRASIALSAGCKNVNTVGESPEKRISLGIALELLHIALSIHKNLISTGIAGNGLEVDKTWVGTIILAGDYCFSRSAKFAAQTGIPEVVAIFSRALQEINEKHLRSIDENFYVDYDESIELCTAGCQAAMLIADLPTDVKMSTLQFSSDLLSWYSKRLNSSSNQSSLAFPEELDRRINELVPTQQQRWRDLAEWMVDKSGH
ncbi:MAG: hypothetical protein AAF702_02720 [Chloroflexota bacterium]